MAIETAGPVAETQPARFAGLDAALAWATEVPAALLVLVEILVLFAGVVARYVVHRPLVWSDELASILFLWLAMLGAVIALRRGEHMRLTAVVALMRPARRAFFETLAALVVAVFVLQILVPAYEYFEDEALITTPALAIPNSWRVAALGVGAVLMMVIALARLVERSTAREAAAGIAVILAVAVALWLLKPMLLALGNL